MADLIRTIDLIFGAVDNTGGVVKSVGKQLETLEKNVGDITGPLASLTGTILKTSAAINGLGIAALAFAVNEAVKFEDASLDLQKVLSESEGSVDQYRDAILELSNRFGVAASEVLQSTANYRQAGFDIDESLGLVEAALTAVRIAEIDTATASERFISILKAFELPASQIGAILDQVNAVTNQFGANADELTAGLARLGPVANAAGLSLDETIGILTPAIEILRSGEIAGRGLRTALLRLQDDSKPVQEALALLGVTQFDVNGELRNARDILFDVGENFGSLSAAQQVFVAGQLAGKENSEKFIPVIRNLAQVAEISAVALEGVGKSAADELAIRLDSTGVSIDRTRTAFVNAAATVGTIFLPSLRGVIDSVGEVARVFQRVVETGGLDDFLAGLEPLFNRIQTNFQNLADNLPDVFMSIDFEPFTRSLNSIASAIGGIFGDVDLSTPEGLAKAIQLVIDSAAGLNEIVAGIITGFGQFVPILLDAAEGFNNLDDSTKAAIGQFLGLATGLNTTLPVLSAVGGALGALGGTLQLLNATGGFAGLVAGAGAATTAMAALGGAANAAVGALGVSLAAFAGFKIGEFISENDILGIATAAEGAAAAIDDVFDFTGTAEARNSLDGLEQSFLELQAANRAAREDVEKFSEATVEAAAANQEWKGSFTLVGDEIDRSADRLAVMDFAQNTLTTSVIKAAQIAADHTKSTGEQTRALAALEAQVPGTLDKLRSLTTDTQQSKFSLEELANTSAEAALKLREIEGEERVALIKARVEIDTEQIRSATQISVAAFESLQTTVQSTGDTITELFKIFTDPVFDATTGFTTEQLLRDAIESEIENREEALRLQRDQIQAEIELTRARTRRLAEGLAEITVSADGLEPELEAFMFRIIERIQLRASEEGASFLLALPTQQ